MKRKISAILTLVSLLICQLALPSSTAAAVDDGLVFSMDISEYSDSAPLIKNSAAGGDSDGIVFKGVNNTAGNPRLATFESGNGDTPFLTFTDPENVTDAGRYGSFMITKAKLTELGITDSDELTFEWWGNTYQTSGGGALNSKVFKYGITSMDYGYQEIYLNPNKTFSFRASGDDTATSWWQAAAVGIDTQMGSWHHYVWTRKWNSDTNKWTMYLYRDGEVVSALNGAAGGYKPSEDNAAAAICVGSNYNGYNVYGGGIGAFNIYTRALSQSDALANYNATKADFTAPLKIVLAEEDMSQYTVGESPTGTEMFTQSRTIEHDMSDIKVREVQSLVGTETIKYIEMSNGGASAKDTYYGYKFSPVFSENFVVDTNIRLDGTSPQSRALRWGKSTIIHDMRSPLSAEVDEFGFHNLRYIFVKGDDDKYDMTCIDLLSGETIATKADIATTCEHILLQQYHTPGADKYLNISKFKVYRYIVPEITNHNAASLTLDDEYITLEFNKALTEESITNDCFTLTNITTGRNIPVELDTCDASAGTVSVRLREYLDATNSYKLDISGIRDVDNFEIAADTAVEFTMSSDVSTVTNVIWKDSEDSVITQLGSQTNAGVSVKVNNSTTDSRDYKVILMLANSDGIICDVAAATAEDATYGETTINASLSGNVAVSAGYSLRLLVWEDTGNGYKLLQQTPTVLQ